MSDDLTEAKILFDIFDKFWRLIWALVGFPACYFSRILSIDDFYNLTDPSSGAPFFPVLPPLMVWNTELVMLRLLILSPRMSPPPLEV